MGTAGPAWREPPPPGAVAERGRVALAIRHAAFAAAADPAAQPLAAARQGLTDRHRLGLLLQGAALLGHLRSVGLDLEMGAWAEATLGPGVLLGLPARSVVSLHRDGRRGPLAQQLLRELLQMLFGGSHSVAGRGEARRIARRLQSDWGQELTDVRPQRVVRRLLVLADFLWSQRYAEHRRALVASSAISGRPRIIGPRHWRRELLARSSDAADAERLAMAEDARDLWHPSPSLRLRPPRELFLERRWRAAALAWERSPPVNDRERYEEARALFAQGAFRAALDRFRRLDRVWARMYGVACLYQLGELHRAQRALLALEREALGARETLALAEVAQRVFAAREDRTRQRDWIARSLRAGRGRHRGRAHLLAAWGRLDLGDAERFARHLDRARSYGVPEEHAWQLHHAEGTRLLLSGRAAEATREISSALGSRRLLRVFEAGRLWNDLATARWAAGERAAAERAIEHSHRLMSRCDGPVATSLCLANLADIRMRCGRFDGVADLVERCEAVSRAQDNRRGVVHDRILRARLHLLVGELGECLDVLDTVEADLCGSGELICDPGEPAALRALALGLRGQGAAAGKALQGIDRIPALAAEREEIPAIWLMAGRRAEALRDSPPGAVGELWRAVAAGGATGELLASAVRSMQSHGAARLVLLVHRLAPEIVDVELRLRAARHLVGCGAGRLAEPLAGGEGDESRPAVPNGLERRDEDGSGRRPPSGRWEALWEHLAQLIEQTPASESALREWFERLPGSELGVTLQGSSRRWVLRQGPAPASGEAVDAVEIDGRCGVWRLERGPSAAACRVLVETVERQCEWIGAPSGVGARSGGSAPGDGRLEEMVGDSPALLAATRQLRRFARGEIPVLVLGETGTGKELAARAVHRLSPRAAAPFLAVNCAALSETLLLSDLFGHARGAFTGADRQHVGVFESAEGGTVFLDEIGDLPPVAQGMLLRVLQEGEIRRVGETAIRRVDVRVIAATHRDLETLVREGAFRQDLLFRLNVAVVTLPPLRERGDDAVRLAETFLAELAGAGDERRLSPEALESLRSHSWPGNVRELRGAVQRALALCEPDTVEIGPDILGLAGASSAREAEGPWHEWLERIKRDRLARALSECSGNQAEAARRLGITRQAMSYLVRQLGVSRPES
ncbi:MAG: sigma-54-dependent Fis family transcriptional regulator [Acidobacteria bacterium]|nr:MAG: sigma-54-dependent Fis family transcriptional regulator [Acidobacteriota bacterium]REK11639.1 MAG: sigma-54-dependent Fis family transcriptional regulator [Acidobacteriota bacterium]